MENIDDLYNEIINPGKYGSEQKYDVNESNLFWYDRYLQSEHWHKVKVLMYNKHNGKCQYCKCDKNLQVHHISYEHIGEEENYLDDLRLLCKKCHKKIHGIL